MELERIKKIKELTDVETVNEFLDGGWKLFRIFNINNEALYIVVTV